jgi:hypothetical protein
MTSLAPGVAIPSRCAVQSSPPRLLLLLPASASSSSPRQPALRAPLRLHANHHSSAAPRSVCVPPHRDKTPSPCLIPARARLQISVTSRRRHRRSSRHRQRPGPSPTRQFTVLPFWQLVYHRYGSGGRASFSGRGAHNSAKQKQGGKYGGCEVTLLPSPSRSIGGAGGSKHTRRARAGNPEGGGR